jgi:hypothetical protein
MADIRLTRQFVEVMVPVPTSGMDIRLTRQFVEVMVPVPTSGMDIRLTRQFVEVMVQPFDIIDNFSDTLTLTETVAMVSNYGEASEAIGLTEAVADFGPYPVDTSDTLGFTDVASGTGPWPVAATDSLGLSDEAPEPGGPFLVYATDSLGLTESDNVVGGSVDENVTEPLGLTETDGVAGGGHEVDRTESLNFNDYAAVVGGDLSLSASDTLGLSEDDFETSGGARDFFAVDTLSLTEFDFETAGGARDFFAVDTLSLTDSVGDFGDVRLAEISESLGLTEAVVDGGDIREEASDTLTLTDAIQEYECISEDLGLTDEAISDEGHFAEDSLGLTDEAVSLLELCFDETDSLNLTDTFVLQVDYNIDLTEALTVTLEQYVIGDPGFYEDIDVGLRELASAGGNINVTIVDALSWFEIPNSWIIPAAGATETATDSLGLTDSAQTSTDIRASDALGWTDAADAFVSRPATDTCDLTDTAEINGDFNVSADDTFVFSESFGSLLSEDTCDYDESQAGPYPADTGLSFRLVGVGSWSVRAPRFQNKDVFSPQRIVNESRGGTLLITSQPEWPKVEVLKMDFSVLQRQEGLDLQDFLSNNLGQVITLTDWEGRAWTGVVTDTNVPLTEISTDNFAMGFEFEGTKV